MDLDTLHELNSLDIRELLDQDSRPTLVIDLDPDEQDPVGADIIRPVFCNSALRLHERLLDDVVGKHLGTASNDRERSLFNDFKSWATGVTTHDDSKDVFPLSF